MSNLKQQQFLEWAIMAVVVLCLEILDVFVRYEFQLNVLKNKSTQGDQINFFKKMCGR